MTAAAPIAVVTGANRGLGRAIARAFAAAGYDLALSARDPATLSESAADVRNAGRRAFTAACDVEDEDSVRAFAEAVTTGLGPPHTVVANAGVAGPTAPLSEIDLAQWRSCLAVDLDGVFLTFRHFIPTLVEAGNLIAISSMTGKRPLAGRTPYAAAKMGVIGLVRTLAVELGPRGLRVNAVCPGAIAGPRLDAVIEAQARTREVDTAAAKAAFSAASPLGRFVEADEVAQTCVFLASPAAASITGEEVNVNAGVAMY